MKVAIVTNGVKPVPDVEGGAVEHLTTVLINQNEVFGRFEFDVFSLENDKIENNYKHTKIIQVKNRQRQIFIRIFFSLVNRLCYILKIKRHYDYISLAIASKVKNGYDYVLVENSIFISKILRKKYSHNLLVHLHNDFDTIDYDFDKTEDNVCDMCKGVYKVLAASDYLKRHITEKTNANNVYSLTNCIDKTKFNPSVRATSRFRKKYKINSDDFVVLFCGRLTEEKGTLELILALNHLRHFKNIKLVIAGNNYFGSNKESAYIKKIEEAIEPIRDNVIMCGMVAYERMPEVYGAADVVVIPTQCVEAFGMTALEAISIGVPCIASRSGGLVDILDEECARFVKHGENYVIELADAIAEIYNMSSDNRNLMMKHAIEKSKAFFSETEYYGAFCRILDDEREKINE